MKNVLLYVANWIEHERCLFLAGCHKTYQTITLFYEKIPEFPYFVWRLVDIHLIFFLLALRRWKLINHKHFKHSFTKLESLIWKKAVIARNGFSSNKRKISSKKWNYFSSNWWDIISILSTLLLLKNSCTVLAKKVRNIINNGIKSLINQNELFRYKLLF